MCDSVNMHDGIIVFYRYDIISIINYSCILPGRFINICICANTICNTPFNLFCVYLPFDKNSRKDSWKIIHTAILANETSMIILVGDFNCQKTEIMSNIRGYFHQ